MSNTSPVGASGPVGMGMPAIELENVRAHIEKFLAAFEGPVSLKEGVAELALGEEINLNIKRMGEQIVLTFQAPGPMLHVHYLLNFSKRIQGATLDTDAIVIGIERFPDVTLTVVS